MKIWMLLGGRIGENRLLAPTRMAAKVDFTT